MEKRSARQIWIAGAVCCTCSAALAVTGYLPPWAAAAVIVCLFPVTVLALFFWWMAGRTGGDIPFIGY